MQMFVPERLTSPESTRVQHDASQRLTPVAQLGPRWQVGALLSPHEDFQHVSFVNGVSTPRGGTHVEHAAAALLDKLMPRLAKQLKLKESELVRVHLCECHCAISCCAPCNSRLPICAARDHTVASYLGAHRAEQGACS
eukprot:1686779-Prymnesium_polylepis.1